MGKGRNHRAGPRADGVGPCSERPWLRGVLRSEGCRAGGCSGYCPRGARGPVCGLGTVSWCFLSLTCMWCGKDRLNAFDP